LIYCPRCCGSSKRSQSCRSRSRESSSWRRCWLKLKIKAIRPLDKLGQPCLRRLPKPTFSFPSSGTCSGSLRTAWPIVQFKVVLGRRLQQFRTRTVLSSFKWRSRNCSRQRTSPRTAEYHTRRHLCTAEKRKWIFQRCYRASKIFYLRDIKILLNGPFGARFIGDVLSASERDKNANDRIF
jgi:hypothetical protein